MTLVVNLFGGPNAGKSTLAGFLFSSLKLKGYVVDIALEYAKIMGYEKRYNILQDQLYIFAKQNRALKRLSGSVDIIVTDSPLLLGLAYTEKGYYPSFSPLVWEVFNSYNNLNFLLQPRNIPFQQEGRFQNKEESKEKHKEIESLLDRLNVEYTPIINSPQLALDNVLSLIEEKVSK